MLLRIEPNQAFMLIHQKNVFMRLIQPLSQDKADYKDLGEIKAPLLRDFYQASCGIEGFLSKAGL